MLIITEADAARLVNMDEAITAMESAFTSIYKNEAISYPVIREHIQGQQAVFGIKSGENTHLGILGLKAGGYWQENHNNGISNHQSCTLLFNPENGKPSALVSSNYLTGMRTAAVAGLATRMLSQRDASSMAIIGAGKQALFQIKSVLSVRPITSLYIASRNVDKAKRLAEDAKKLGIKSINIVSVEAACREAEIITTITPSSEPIIKSDWVRPGAHINAMGSDTKGKKELDPKILNDSIICADNWDQAKSLGECQSLNIESERALPSNVIFLSDLVGGKVVRNETTNSKTIFDSTGLAIQDLAIAHLVLSKAAQRSDTIKIQL